MSQAPNKLRIEEAEAVQTTLRAALDGVAGSGKTYGALQMAKGLVNYNPKAKADKLQICVIDLENKTSTLERQKPEQPRFALIDIQPPYTVARVLEALQLAEQQGYEVVIIDGLTKVWLGSGGLMEQKTKLIERGMKDMSAWRKVDEAYRKLMERLQTLPFHCIVTMRSKNKLVVEQDEDGKTKINKRSLEAEMRPGAEYEFDLTFTLDRSTHFAEVKLGKDRTGMFENRDPFLISEETGKEIRNWFSGVKPKEAKVIAESSGPEPVVDDSESQEPKAEKPKAAPPKAEPKPEPAPEPSAEPETGEAISTSEKNTVIVAARAAGIKTPNDFKSKIGFDMNGITKAQLPKVLAILKGLKDNK